MTLQDRKSDAGSGQVADLARLREWIGTVDGFLKAIIALVLTVGALWALISAGAASIAEQLGLPAAAAHVPPAVLFFGLLFLAWRDWRRFVRLSRVEQPDRFVLSATGPDRLVGRERDVKELSSLVKRHRIVLLDGESGCGKSALISAGLVPALRAEPDGLLPIHVASWGTDRVRGPMASVLEALSEVLTGEEKRAIGWDRAPDLAADEASLRAQVAGALDAIRDRLKRTPLLIADQFDDYQAQALNDFRDGEGNWLSPAEFARGNAFWALVCERLEAGTLHLLVVTRSDTASGLHCIRFLDKDMIGAKTLEGVEEDRFPTLLAGFAPDGADPPVVSNPANGWHDLRDRLESDLREQGAILMQQVRTLLLGLRGFRRLTLKAYNRAGGLRGVETLYVARALERAGAKAGGGLAGVKRARALLSELVLPQGVNQPPKVRQRTEAELAAVCGDAGVASSILAVLEQEEVIRRVPSPGSAPVWQLDHDYLAQAVLREAAQAERWRAALREGLSRFKDAEGSLRRRWAAALGGAAADPGPGAILVGAAARRRGDRGGGGLCAREPSAAGVRRGAPRRGGRQAARGGGRQRSPGDPHPPRGGAGRMERSPPRQRLGRAGRQADRRGGRQRSPGDPHPPRGGAGRRDRRPPRPGLCRAGRQADRRGGRQRSPGDPHPPRSGAGRRDRRPPRPCLCRAGAPER